MPRVHFVREARKDNPAVKKGESYYCWKFRYGPKRYSKIRPTRSQLTQSSLLSTLYDIEDSLGEEITQEEAGALLSELEALLDECQCSLDNMPEPLQDSSESGILLQERIYGLEDWMAEIENIDWDSVTPKEAMELVQDTNPGLS